MNNWTYHCGRVICNLADATSTMTGPMRMGEDNNVPSRQIVRLRLQGARRVAMVAVHNIDKLLADLEKME